VRLAPQPVAKEKKATPDEQKLSQMRSIAFELDFRDYAARLASV
jgi:hypothetical protein